MRSSFVGLEMSKRSIQVSQKALDIVGNNLANVGTDGYTRQRVDTASLNLGVYNNWTTRQARLMSGSNGVVGLGVEQIRNSYIDKRYRQITCYVAEYDTKSSVLSEIETTMDNIDNDGITQSLDTLKSALTKYATDNADSEELATIVRNASYNMTTLLRTYSTDLEKTRQNNIYELQSSVEDVNTILRDIADYNRQIVHEYAMGNASEIYNGEGINTAFGPNELLDSRNLLLDELSYYGNISVETNTDGSVHVKMGNTTVVDGEDVTGIIMKDFESYGAAVLRFQNGDDVVLQTGDIKAYTDMLNGNGPYASYYQNSEYGIPYYQKAVDAFAESFAGLMNSLNGADEDPSRALFGTYDDVYDDDGNIVSRGNISAGNIKISEEWMANPTIIGQHYNSETQEWEEANLDGNNVNAILLGLESNISIGSANDYNGSIYDYVTFLSDRIAQSIEYNNDQYDVANTTANGFLDNREAISGVSDTEEGIDMMTFQKWFNASSRMMTTLDDCLNTIINSMGRVGL